MESKMTKKTTYVVTVPVLFGKEVTDQFWGDSNGSGYTVVSGIQRAKKYKTLAGAERAIQQLMTYTDTTGKVVEV